MKFELVKYEKFLVDLEKMAIDDDELFVHKN